MIITLAIRDGIIALNLINEHKIETKWFSGWPRAHNGASFILDIILSMKKEKAPFQSIVINIINGTF